MSSSESSSGIESGNWDDKPEPTVDSIRKEIRAAIFECAFMATGFDIEQRTSEAEIAKQRACGFVALGVNTKLFTPQEGNDWLDAIFERNGVCLADICEKYDA